MGTTNNGEKLNELKISYKKSAVKLGKGKTLLFEVKSTFDKNSILFFTDRSKYIEIKNDPSVAIEIVKPIGGLSEIIEKALSTPTKISVKYKGIIKNKTSIISNIYK
ncbi:hypothetical protein V6B14_22455 (plasmid) [Sporosarcina psychrophila]|uniref:hypothetical protein n=1 Tax=Sporosarcina psychrophila TaxID=1476 RepID=UPI0030D54477